MCRGAGFLFTRRVFSNAMTNALKENPNLPVDEVLLHPDLAVTLRNEADGLMEYLGADDPQNPGSPRIRTVIRWALTLENNNQMPCDFTSRFRLYQVNRNASTFLAYPSQRLYNDLLLKDDFFINEILKFQDSELALDPTFAGHWQRVISMFFRRCDLSGLTRYKGRLRKILFFIIAHADILAYQYLINIMIVDFQAVLGIVLSSNRVLPGLKVDPVVKFIILVLNEACRQVFWVRNEIRVNEEGQRDMVERLLKVNIAGSFGSGGWFELRSFGRPMTWEHKIVPQPVYQMSQTVLTDPDLQHPPDKRGTVTNIVQELYRNPPTKFEMQWMKTVFTPMPRDNAPKPGSKITDAINRAYLLLNAIQAAYIEAQNMLDFLQNKEVLERLLVCGVFCDPVSMVSSQAFRLIRLILYPDLFNSTDAQCQSLFTTFDAPELNASQDGRLPEKRIDFSDTVNQFASEFFFSDPPLPQMIAAISAFWNYRYPVLPNIGLKVEPEVLKPVQLKMKDGGCSEVDMTGRTPLELFNHCLLEEPAWSDALNFRIMQILLSEEAGLAELLQADRPSNMTEEQFHKMILKKHEMFFRFLAAKFKTREPQPPQIPRLEPQRPRRPAEKKDEFVWTDMSFVSHLMGAVPQDQDFVNSSQRFHVPLNGYVYTFIRFWQKHLMFLIDNDPTAMFSEALKLSDGALYAAAARREFEATIQADANRDDKGEGKGPKVKLVQVGTCLRSPPYVGPVTLDLESR
jgi:hypothetical protein